MVASAQLLPGKLTSAGATPSGTQGRAPTRIKHWQKPAASTDEPQCCYALPFQVDNTPRLTLVGLEKLTS